jgi:regulator of cell morphogenesis and NO signaling
MSETAPALYASRTLADIASALPGATAVFRRRKLDFCCGGRVKPAAAAAAKGLDADEIAAELATIATDTAPEAAPLATGDLITLIETRYHTTHRRELPELVRLACRVETVHGDYPLAPAGIAALLARMATELANHMRKEEEILFPLMRQGGHAMIAHPIAAMLAEHDDHGANLHELERIAHGFDAPAKACPTWRALYVGARKLTDDLMEHIALENNVLFPRFA